MKPNLITHRVKAAGANLWFFAIHVIIQRFRGWEVRGWARIRYSVDNAS